MKCSHAVVCLQVERELGSLKLGRVSMVSGGSLVPLGVEEQSGLMHPVLILESSGLVHTPLLAGKRP